MAEYNRYTPLLVLVLYLVAEIEYELPVFAGEVLVGRLGCGCPVSKGGTPLLLKTHRRHRRTDSAVLP